MSISTHRATLIVDGILAALFFAVCVLYAFVGGWPDVVVVTLFSAALVLRRAAPGAALGVAWVAACVQMLMLRELQPADAAVFVVVYSTSAHGSRVVRWWGLGSAGAGALIGTLYLAFLPTVDPTAVTPPGDAVGMLMWSGLLFGAALAGLVLAWTMGLLVRTVRDSREQRRRAELDRREREHAEYRYVVEQERSRIARDMHDVVAHSLAVVIAQADGARFAARVRPEAAVDALATISGVARGALGDVRLLLGELRHREGESPQPALDDLDDLLEQVRGAGLDVRRTERGERVPLGAGHQIAVYRIVQEGLTNALRHGDTAQPVHLALDWSRQGVAVQVENAVTDDGDGTRGQDAVPGPRHGIPGMRERAELAGGTFAAESLADGRFRITARIPAQAAP